MGVGALCAEQLSGWVYGRGVHDPRHMTNLSVVDRGILSLHFAFADASLANHQISSDGTQKLLLRWPAAAGGKIPAAETVLIPDGPRLTACISSQVGCPVGCTFCASGVNGVAGNLTAAQIVEQVIWLNGLLRGQDQRISNVVFMGMGEPLSNYAQVMQAVRVLHDPKFLNISARKITISTVGVPQKIRQLADEQLPLNLAISLHAPNEPLRRQLIPWAQHFSLDEILDAARFYFSKTGREITLEYILLASVNDQPPHARQLATLCKTLRANVNLIRYNEVDGLPYNRPKAADVVVFQGILRNHGVNAHVRRSRGRDIDAACGQLRRKQDSHLQPGGFSAVELLVVLGIVVILISIFIPFLLSHRETERRIRCADNLNRLCQALEQYAALNGGDYPRVIYDPALNANGYSCYTGVDSSNPFAHESTVQPSDVTASLWLLVRLRMALPVDFICPSTDDWADPVDDASGRPTLFDHRGNFRGPAHLSYSYASPFSAAWGYRLNDTRKPDFAVMADKNPGVDGLDSNVTLPSFDAPALKLQVANSKNHAGAGQNVLYADGHVAFQSTPYCGVEHDNIYTALSPLPLQKGQSPPADGNGVVGITIGPSWSYDSYLVPLATDSATLVKAELPPPPPSPPTSRPTAAPTTAPATQQAASRPASLP